MKHLTGRPIAPGIAIGRLQFLKKNRLNAVRRHVGDSAAEIRRAEAAFDRALSELAALCEKSRAEGGADCAGIFEAHRQLLSDADYLASIRSIIISEHVNAAYAAEAAGENFCQMLERTDDAYLRERAADIRDISERLVRILTEAESTEAGGQNETEGAETAEGRGAENRGSVSGNASKALFSSEKVQHQCKDGTKKETAQANGEAPAGMDGLVLAAESLSPSETVQLDRSRICAFLTARGSANSHAAILARIMGIPAVSGICLHQIGRKTAANLANGSFEGDSVQGTCGKTTQNDLPQVAGALDGMNSAERLEGTAPDTIKEGVLVIVDGGRGEAIVDPDEKTLEIYRKRQAEERRERNALMALRGKPAETRSGRRIRLYGNAGKLEDIDAAFANGAEGIGLLRTEFLFLDRKCCPDEEEQFQIYREALQKAAGQPLIVRTLDIGADKQPAYLPSVSEENPALGLRGIRLSLTEKELFRTQLRALLRASAYGRLAILYPMIGSVRELREVRYFVAALEEELARSGVSFDAAVLQGAMIETPAAALTAERLAEEADFFSIGTNDLTQYTLAADRQGSAGLERFYDPHHEAVLRLIRMTAEAARRAGKQTGICGELAADESLSAYFLELGIDTLSVAPPKLLPLKKHIRELE